MKKSIIALAALALLGSASSCDDKLDVVNTNQQTTGDFGDEASELEEAVIACYNHTRMEGTYARVGYMIDVCRGEECWNAGQVWYLPYDNYTVPETDEIGQWVLRDWMYTNNVCNFILQDVETATLSEDQYNQIKGQAEFIRGLAYYNLATYFQTVPLITDYNTYSTLDGLYVTSASQDSILDQVEADFKDAMAILPSRDKGGEWACGRATCGAAAGFYARTLMFRHKFSEALTVLEDIINGKYGTYRLMDSYGDNFREGTAYENNAESLYEVQYLDYGQQGTDDEWTPVNTSANATQGHAIESNFGPACFGGWGDISAAPWLYKLFKAEKTTDGHLDPRLYWTLGTYEAEYDTYNFAGDDTHPRNVLYGYNVSSDNTVNGNYLVTNKSNGGIPVVKHTAARLDDYQSIVTGLHCGVNLRMMRYSDVLLRAAECENEVNGPTAKAFGWINQVRNRAGLANLVSSSFPTSDALFEQIANVERPKEFGCEFGRGTDLIRWGFFYDKDRLAQMAQHSAVMFDTIQNTIVPPVEKASYNSFKNYVAGHEYLIISQVSYNANPNIGRNSANTNTDNSTYYFGQGWTVHPVVDLGFDYVDNTTSGTTTGGTTTGGTTTGGTTTGGTTEGGSTEGGDDLSK